MALLQTIKGFRDFEPSELSARKALINTLTSVFEKYGFSEMSTPSLEYQEILLGKYGTDAEKMMYLFKDPGGREVGLKYDLTVPLARYMANHPATPTPFKRYQVQPVWRAENTQRGRYREFYQCDLDIVGSRSPYADSEILTVISECMAALKIPDFTIFVNSRNVLYSVMEMANVEKHSWLKVISILDKLDKKTTEEVAEDLNKIGLSHPEIVDIFSRLKKATPDDYLGKVLDFAQKMGATNIEFLPTISRGLDYYTGPIFETVIKSQDIGSVTGGGRYDNLISDLGGPDLPSVGTAFGIDRLMEVVKFSGAEIGARSQALITAFSEELMASSLELAKKMRDQGIRSEVYLDPNTKLDKQIKYADKKQIKFVIILGPEELSQGKLTLKNMAEKSELLLSLDDALETIRRG